MKIKPLFHYVLVYGLALILSFIVAYVVTTF